MLQVHMACQNGSWPKMSHAVLYDMYFAAESTQIYTASSI